VPARLAFVDEPARLAEVPPEFTVVAVDPLVELATTDAVPLDAQLEDMEVEALGAQTLERVVAACELIDQRGARARDVSMHWRLRELKALYDGALLAGLGATRLVALLEPDEALLLLRPGSAAARIVPEVLQANGVVTRFGPSKVPAAAPTRSQRSGRVAALRLRVERMARRARPRILCLDNAYSMPAIAAALRGRGADVRLWLPPLRRPHPRVAQVPDGLPDLFCLAGIDVWPAFADGLLALIERGTPGDEAAFDAACAAIRRDRPDALLGSVFETMAAKAAASAARRLGIAAITAGHGQVGAFADPVIAGSVDLDTVDWALCWGAWHERFVERYAPRPVHTVVVGSPMIEEGAAGASARVDIRRAIGLADDLPLVLLVVTGVSDDGWFAGRHTPSDLSLVRHQVTLLEQLLAVGGVRVAVKEHPMWSDAGPLEIWARRCGAPVTFIKGREFSDLINLADATVLDFASTTLVQALYGSAHVYVVDHPVIAWEPGVIEHLERHTVRVVPPAELGRVIGYDLASGFLSRPASYPQDAREPLLASGEGTAASRAADAVMRIARDASVAR
jgi:hypothetical protein